MTRASVPAAWQGVVLVCGKCSRKVGGGFGPKRRTSLARALRGLLPSAKGRKAAHGVIETGCLKLCPKRRVVAIDAARPGEWLLIEPGTAIEDVAARLGMAPPAG